MGQYTSIIEIQTNVEKSLKDIIELQGRVDKLEGKEYKVELGVDSKKLESVINNLEKMLKSLGKGTGDFKQFETLSQELSGISKEIQSIGKAFGNIDDSGTKPLLSSIQSIDNLLSSISTNLKTFSQESLVSGLADAFVKIESHLSSLRSVIVDVGDGQEFSPLLKTINDVQSAVSSLSSSIGKIKLNINLNSSGADEEILSEIEARKQSLLDVYRTQYNAMRKKGASGTDVVRSMNASRGKSNEISLLNKDINSFSELDYDNIDQKLNAYIKIFEKMKAVSNLTYGRDIYSNIEDEFKGKISSAKGMITRSKNKLGMNSAEGLESLFGSTDLTGVLTQLEEISSQLKNIAGIASTVGDSLKNNLSFSSISEEITTLIGRLNDLAEGLYKVNEKTNNKDTTISGSATTSASTKEDSSLIEQNKAATEQAVQSKRDFAAANEGVQNSVAESKSALQLEAELMSQLAKDAREAANAKQAFVEANKQVKQSTNNSNNATKKNRYKNYTEMSEDDYMSKYDKLSSTANKFLSDRGYEILGGSVGVKFSNGFARVSAEIKNAEGNWKRFSASVDADSKVFNARFNPITEGINKLNSKLENFGKDVVQSETKKVFDESDLKSFEADVTSLQSKLKKSFSGTDLDKQKFVNSLEDIMSRYRKFKDLFDNGEIDVSNWNKLQRYFESFQNSIDRYSTEKLNPDGKSKKYLDELEKAKALLNELKIIIGQDGFEGTFNKGELDKIDEFIKKIKELYSLGVSKEGKEGNKASFQNILGETEEFLKKNTTMSKELRVQFEALAAEMKAFGDSVPSGDKLVEFGTRLETLKTIAKETGQLGLSFFDGVKQKARSLSQQFIAMYFSLYDFVRYIKTGFNYVKELDTAYTEMRKVSDESKSTLKNYQASTFDVANEVGTTAVQIQNSTADFMRLGESINEAAESAKTANILLNVSEFDSIDSATESLIAMSAAYEELDKMQIVDKLNNVGKSIVAQTYDNIWGYKYISASSYNG